MRANALSALIERYFATAQIRLQNIHLIADFPLLLKKKYDIVRYSAISFVGSRHCWFLELSLTLFSSFQV